MAKCQCAGAKNGSEKKDKETPKPPTCKPEHINQLLATTNQLEELTAQLTTLLIRMNIKAGNYAENVLRLAGGDAKEVKTEALAIKQRTATTLKAFHPLVDKLPYQLRPILDPIAQPIVQPWPPGKPELEVELLQPKIQAYELLEAYGDAKVMNVGNAPAEILLRGYRNGKNGTPLGKWAEFIETSSTAITLPPNESCTVRHHIRPGDGTAGREDETDGWIIDRYTGIQLAGVQMPLSIGATKARIGYTSFLILTCGQQNTMEFTVSNKGESKLTLKVGITEPSDRYGYVYEWFVDGLTKGDTTKELSPGESETGVLHVKPPGTVDGSSQIDVGDHFFIWAEEINANLRLFNGWVDFWMHAAKSCPNLR